MGDVIDGGFDNPMFAPIWVPNDKSLATDPRIGQVVLLLSDYIAQNLDEKVDAGIPATELITQTESRLLCWLRIYHGKYSMNAAIHDMLEVNNVPELPLPLSDDDVASDDKGPG